MPDEVIAAPAKPAAALARGRCFPFGACFAVRFEDDDFQTGGFILRDGASRLLSMRLSNPHSEERGNAARLEP
jgi:hypothetical protein